MIPDHLPDVGTYVKTTRGTRGVVAFYEYYVLGQRTFPVVFNGVHQTMSLDEVTVMSGEVINLRERITDKAEHERAVRSAYSRRGHGRSAATRGAADLREAT